MQNIFSYPIIISDLGNATQNISIKADEAQLGDITEILQIAGTKSFVADINVKYHTKEQLIDVYGSVSAVLELTSVVSLEKFEKHYNTDFEIKFDATPPKKLKDDEELSLKDEILDSVVDGTIDICDIAIEQIALIMEDFPRKDGEEFVFESEFDEETTKSMNPFNILEKMKK